MRRDNEFWVDSTKLGIPRDFGDFNVLNAIFMLDRFAENLKAMVYKRVNPLGYLGAIQSGETYMPKF
jgi:hypothetical protein